MSINLSWRALGRVGVTALALAAAGAVGWRLWQHYEVEPWTRDGRIRANVVQVAPDVTGQVTALFVRDNQRVNAGQPLFEIDRARFELALRQAEAAARAQQVVLDQATRESQRNTELRDLVAQEAREQGQSHLEQTRAALAQALVNRDLARLNLARTRVLSAVNGIVTNLDLQTGAYVTAGHPVMALIDHDSFYAEGYFEETKLAKIHLGDPVAVSLMGEKGVLRGHVDSVAGGIADRDRSTASNLLPTVNPTFNWVRLAQRIPVRVALDAVPDAIRLVAGQTVTVDVRRPAAPALQRQ
jgi:multidrug resistance efflux pump